jgi:CheY-like chemotaxis protein
MTMVNATTGREFSTILGPFMAAPQPVTGTEPGILYYDPNPTTAKLATASLVLAGYQVLHATTKDEAVRLCADHGPAGDGTIVALLLDAAADPRISAAVLRALVQLPGAAELPGILIVSRRNPTPIPGAEGLPSVRRPFSSPALLKVVQETLAGHGRGAKREEKTGPGEREHKLRDMLERHLPGIDFGDEAVTAILGELESAEQMPVPAGDECLRVSLGEVRLEAVLDLIATEGTTGVLEVEDGAALGRLHIQDGKIRLAEYRGDEDLKLGRFVVQAGFARDEDLERILAEQDPERRPLGKRLVDANVLTERQLAQVLADQAREVTCHLLTWRKGQAGWRLTDELHPLALAAAQQEGAELLIAEALLDGLRRLDEGAIMGAHMAGVDDVFIRIDEQIQKLGREGLARDELAVLELVNGRNTVKEVARKTRTGTFAVASVLYRLSKSNVVRRRVTPVTV